MTVGIVIFILIVLSLIPFSYFTIKEGLKSYPINFDDYQIRLINHLDSSYHVEIRSRHKIGKFEVWKPWEAIIHEYKDGSSLPHHSFTLNEEGYNEGMRYIDNLIENKDILIGIYNRHDPRMKAPVNLPDVTVRSCLSKDDLIVKDIIS